MADRASGWAPRRSRAPWGDLRPIRAEQFSDEMFARHAVSLADSHVTVRHGRPVVSLLRRVEENSRALIEAYEFLMDSVEEGLPISPASEWLVDNFHAVEEHIRDIRRDLPPGYFRQLPKLGRGFLEGHPRVFGIMWAYVAHTDSTFDPDQLGRYIRAYETRKALTLGELWAVAIHLRILLVENARRVAAAQVTAARERREANDVADRLLGADGREPETLSAAIPGHDSFRPARPWVVQLMRRLADHPASPAHAWVRDLLREEGVEPEDALQEEHQTQARDSLTMRNIVRSLRLLTDVNWEDWLESVSLIERELRTSPGYAELDFATRNLYRTAVERLARGSRQDEIDVTRAALTRARTAPDEIGQHVGFWLVDDGLRDFERSIGYRQTRRERVVRAIHHAGLPGFVTALTLLTALVLGVSLWLVWWASGGLPGWSLLVLGALGAIPASDFALGMLNYRLTRTLHAAALPALELPDKVPESLRTLVVVPTMITSADGVEEIVTGLETHFLGNDNGEIYFGAVTDWADSPTEHREGDEELLAAAVAGIRGLNERYGHRFFLFHRSRRFNPAEGVWMGWERKRGKLEELNRLLRGAKDTSFIAVEGHLPGPFRYIITLDSDTLLPRTSAKKLIGKIAHPLNRARIDSRGRVVRGYSILAPRVTPSLPPREETSAFQSVFSTQRGLDPYAFTVSDVYQDLFHQGSFAGKGIYDIDTLMHALEGRIPENTVLSHDLLEGNYSRAGLVTDVEVVEDHPTSYEVHASRVHRWTRGDWQLLPWILRRREGLSALALWKMGDNLRRSLVAPLHVVGLLAAVALLPAHGALAWLLLMVTSFILPPLIPLAPALVRRRRGVTARSQVQALAHDAGKGLAIGVLTVTFLAHQAWMMVDAIARTLWRMAFSRRNLLEWTTAAAAQKQAKGTLRRFVQVMAGGLVAPVLLLVVAALRGPVHLLVAAVPAVLWFLAPVVAQRVSRLHQPIELPGTPEQLAELRVIARRTWSFFETFVTAAENDLPPDNFQETPAPTVAHRTSPTNIGLYLLSTISARDLGWIGLTDAVERLERTMHTVSVLEHHHGHLLNWYDTRTLETLAPRYVSSVDSGNLAGHLLAMAVTCEQWAADPGPSFDPHGLADGVALIRQSLDGTAGAATRESLARLDDAVARLGRDGPDGLASVEAALEPLAAALRPGSEAAGWIAAVGRSVVSLRRDADATVTAALPARLLRLADQARREFDGMDFAPLLDPRRELLSVGYQVDDGTLDESCYDLLASECRLGSFVAIAKGDVRTRHWVRLGRGVTAAGGGAALLSWSGSMFEYLMPFLVMRTPEASLLSSTARRVVRRQIEYGRERGVPWGISESGFNARDAEQNYQYSPFGVPGLGIVRGLANNLVIAPYATGLAAMVDPGAAAENYERLAALGARGRYGFHEAVDFTPRRLPQGEGHAVVRSYMAHHQGMTVVAIHEVVTGGLIRERFHAEPIVRATELLLQERAPRDVPVTHAREEQEPDRRVVRATVPAAERTLTGAAALAPGLHLLSNGRLSLRLTPAGGGQLRWRGLAITRWHPDLTTSDTGDYLYLREDRTGRVWSATAEPVRTAPEYYGVRFSEDRARHTRQDGNLRTSVEHHLSPESDAVVRTLTVRNSSRYRRTVTVTSYAELVLARPADDDAHPAFSKLFVQTEFLQETGTLLATRRRRSPDEPEVWVAHFVVPGTPGRRGGGPVGVPLPETDRHAFLGRNRTPRSPRRLDEDVREPGTTGHVLDPVLSLSQDLEVPPDGTASLQFWTVVAGTRAEVLRLADQHRAAGAHDRVTALAWTQSQILLRDLGLTPDEAGHFQDLAGRVLFPQQELRAPATALLESGPQSSLWPLGISGDLPLLVVRVSDRGDLGLVREVIRAFEFWRLKRFAVDVVLLNEGTGYTQDLHRSLTELAGSIRARTGSPDSNGRIFVVRRDQADPRAVATLLAAAAVFLDGGDLASRLAAAAPLPSGLPGAIERIPAAREIAAMPTSGSALRLHNGIGGFDGLEYVIELEPGRATPHPWANVVANEDFGFLATAEGAGHTWWRNSRDNQLTPWRNDPVSAPVSEALYVRDETTGRVSSATASPVGGGRHTARHGFGYTRWTHDMDGVELDQTVFVPTSDPVKLTVLRLTNRTGEQRVLTVTAYAELVLGNDRIRESRHLVTEIDPGTRALLARNPWSIEYHDQVVFLDMAGRQESWTGDRREFLGLHGTTELPQAVFRGQPLSGVVGAGLDPCAAMQVGVVLEPGAEARVLVLLGAGPDTAAARSLVVRYRERNPLEVLAEVRASWAERLGAVQVTAPSAPFTLMMNGWLLYQALSCRMLARAAWYQVSGAYGFRDQLQDALAVVLVEPGLARAHLLRAAGRQFLAGDVQHWWLPTTGAGIRTRISDDVVWLAHAVARYVEVTGDTAILDERLSFLEGEPLADDELERFFVPDVSATAASLYDHCVLALEHAFRYGRHGLPLMGTGDWNDGMNRVGAAGDGESVWLGWFLHGTLTQFAALAEARGEATFAARCREQQESLIAALEEHGWDGSWYRRGFFDDATPLGSASRPECRIDAIAQSWAVLSGAARPERAIAAMEEAERQLVLGERVVRLFTPPFDTSEPDPGYIRAYPPGVRENGGQYTHGALWSVFAWAALGREDRAFATLDLLNPVTHALSPEDVERYRVEPYVVAADVYGEPPHVGRGGWTWYTGSAGWMFRAGLEAILGLRRRGPVLEVEPCLPPEWTRAEVRLRVGTSSWEIALLADAPAPRRVACVVVDDVPLPDTRIPLIDDGATHRVEVILEARRPVVESVEPADG